RHCILPRHPQDEIPTSPCLPRLLCSIPPNCADWYLLLSHDYRASLPKQDWLTFPQDPEYRDSFASHHVDMHTMQESNFPPYCCRSPSTVVLPIRATCSNLVQPLDILLGFRQEKYSILPVHFLCACLSLQL